MDIFILLLSGLLGGVLAGLLGIGGGVIYIMVFTIWLEKFADVKEHILVKLTIANATCALVFAGLSGSIKHFLNKNFFPKPVFIVGLAGVVSSILTTYILGKSESYDKAGFALVFSILIIPMIIRMLFKKDEETEIKDGKLTFPVLLFTGIFSGMITALSGLGGGFIMVPLFYSVFGVDMKKTISISLGVITTVALGLTLYNLLFVTNTYLLGTEFSNPIIFRMVIPVVIGVLIGAPIGVSMAMKFPARVLKITFIILCLGVMARLIYSAVQ